MPRDLEFGHPLLPRDWEFGHPLLPHDWEFGHPLLPCDLEFGHPLLPCDLEFGHPLLPRDWKFGHPLLPRDWKFGHPLLPLDWEFGHPLLPLNWEFGHPLTKILAISWLKNLQELKATKAQVVTGRQRKTGLFLILLIMSFGLLLLQNVFAECWMSFGQVPLHGYKATNDAKDQNIDVASFGETEKHSHDACCQLLDAGQGWGWSGVGVGLS